VADLDIYETVAAAAAQGREPDLSAFDPNDVRGALERVLRYPVPREQFLTWLQARVQQLSDGRVTVEERMDVDGPENDQETTESVPELPVRLVIEGEPFA